MLKTSTASLFLLSSMVGALPAQQDNPPRVTERGATLQVVEPDAADRDLRMSPVVRAVQQAADSVVSIYLQD